MTSFIWLSVKEQSNAEHLARDWVDNAQYPISGEELKLSTEAYLSCGGPQLYNIGMLSVEYCFVRALLDQWNKHVGYATFRIQQYHRLQSYEVYVFDNVSYDRRLFIVQPEQSEITISEKLSGLELEIYRYAVVCKRMPKRSKLSVPNASLLLNASRADGALRMLYEVCGIQADTKGAARLAANWSNMTPKDRVEGIFDTFCNWHYVTVGTPTYLNNLMPSWPFEGINYPEGRSDDWDNSAEWQAGMRNILENIALHAKVIEINSAQRRLFESTLLKVETCGDIAGGLNEKTEIWEGVTASGETVWCLGHLRGVKPLVFVANISGNATQGERVYMDRAYKRVAGKIVAALWKSRNHSKFIKPEEQKGVYLVAAV